MQLTLQQAATVTGKAKSTIQRAIKSGKLSAIRKDDGSYSIDVSELSRVYVLHDTDSEPVAMKQSATANESELLRLQVALLQQQIDMLKDTTQDLRKRLDDSDSERRKLLTLLSHDQNATEKKRFKFW